MSKKRNGKEHHIKQLYLNVMGNRRMMEETSSELKKKGDFSAVSAALNSLFQSNSKYEKLVHGYLKPLNVEHLGKCNGYYFEPHSLESEMLWQIMQIKRYKGDIKKFLSIRRKFENLFLLGDFSKALELLENSVKEIGLSVWYYEQKILTYCYLNRTKELLEWLSEINKINENAQTGYVSFLLAYLHKRSLKNVSPVEYDLDLFSRFKRNITSFDEDKYNYFLFRLNYYHTNSYVRDYSRMLLFESPNSAIDRYLNIVNVLKACFFSTDADRNQLATIALKLYRLLGDEQLFSLLAYIEYPMPTDYYDQPFIRILDSYYTGKYEETVKQCAEYVKLKPSNFDILKLYCRSLLFLGRTEQRIVENVNSPLNYIIERVLRIMKGNQVRQSQNELNQICKNMYGLTFCSSLDAYVKEEYGIRNNHIKLLNCTHFDPRFTLLFNDDKKKLNYLDTGNRVIEDSIVITYQKGRIKNLVAGDSPVVPYIREVDNGKILFKQGKYEDCISLMEKVITMNKGCVPVVQSAIDYVFNSYIKINQEEEAILYFVDKYIENHSYTSKIDSKAFIRHLKRKRYSGIRYSLSLLLFVFENANDETDKSYVLETYLKYKEVKDVVGLIKDYFSEDGDKEEEEFLVHIITDDILRHTTFIDSTQAILEQERHILTYLINLESSRKVEYEGMMQQLTEEMIAYDGAIKDDESKIFANIPSIIKYELESAKRLYAQFQSFYKTESLTFIYILDGGKMHQENDGKQYAYLGQTAYYTDNALKEISNQLFDEIRQQFLKSKFGLGTYLSTRIRHGVFEGELRSVFSGNGIALSMENEKYQPNYYWRNHYKLNQESHKKLMERFEILSTKLDALIRDFKSNVLQIKLKNEDKGAFNYIIDEDTICLHIIDAYRKSEDFELFCWHVMNYLWELTEKSLAEIRAKIRTELTKECHSLLDELEESTKICNSNFITDFKTVLSDARTQLAQRLLKIEGWFHIQDMKFEDYDFKKLTEICWDITCKMHPNTRCEINAKSNVDGKIMLVGNSRIHVSDLIRIFYTNMIKYSKKEQIRFFQMDIKLENNILDIRFENKIEGGEDTLNCKLKALLNNLERLQKEGGSGLVKARKIVKYDLGCVDNEIKVEAKEGKCICYITINIEKLKR